MAGSHSCALRLFRYGELSHVRADRPGGDAPHRCTVAAARRHLGATVRECREQVGTV